MHAFKSFRNDILAGTTVALILIPQSLAYAQLAGLPPQFGLYASLLPPLIASLFGSSKYLATGPVAILSLMTFAELNQYYPPGSPEYISLALLMAFMLGLFQLTLGIFKLGNFISLISHPVIYGFITASSIIIAATELPKFLNIVIPAQDHMYQSILILIDRSMSGFDITTLTLGIWALLLMITLRKVNQKLPVILITVIASTLLAKLINYSGPLVGNIPLGLPVFSPPVLNLTLIEQLLPTLIAMGLIGFTEAISISQAVAIKTKDRINPNKELIGQGLANIIGSFSQSYPVSGSFSRTAVSLNIGAGSKIAGVATAVVVLLVLLFFTEIFSIIPRVALAAVIVYSVSVFIDLKKIKYIWHTKKYDGIAALLTFMTTLYFAPHLEKGILTGVLFSVGFFIYRSFKPNIIFVSTYKDGQLHDANRFKMKKCTNIAVVRLDSRLYFANAEYFEQEIINYIADNPDIAYVLIVSVGINDIDSTGEESLRALYQNLHSAGKYLYFAYTKTPVRKVLKRTGFMDKVGHDHFFTKTDEAVAFLINKADTEGIHMDKDNCPLKKYVKNDLYTEKHSRVPRPLSLNIQKLLKAYNFNRKSSLKSVDSKRRL